jgi:hypothetical protein
MVETNFGSIAPSFPVSLIGARKDHVNDLAQELHLLAEAQQPHDFLRIYLLATPKRCTELAAWFEETLWARHGVWDTDEGWYEKNVHAFRRTLYQWRSDPFNGREAGMAWIKAFGEGLSAPFIEPCGSNETLVDLLARFAFGERRHLPGASIQTVDASLAVRHESNVQLKGFDSLQHVFEAINARAMAAGIDEIYSLDPIQVLHVSTFQRKLIDQSGGDADLYALHLAEHVEILRSCLLNQTYHVWCRFLHMHCGFPEADQDLVQ